MGKTEIDKIARINLSNLRGLIKAGDNDRSNAYSCTFSSQGLTYKAIYSHGCKSLLFVFTDRAGAQQVRKVVLLREPINLGRGSVLYFLCPYTGHKCRKLFLDGYTIASRYAFSHVYSYQKQSHKNRLLDGRAFDMNHPETKGRKPIYRGELTRYGKRVLRYYKKIEQAEKKLLLYLKPVRRGRPPKE